MRGGAAQDPAVTRRFWGVWAHERSLCPFPSARIRRLACGRVSFSWILAASSADDWAVAITVIAAVISAIGVLIGGIYWFATRGSRAERAKREEEVSQDIAEMSENLEKLETLVIAVAEDVQGRRPEPILHLITAQGPAASVSFTLPAIPEVDIDAIVESERRQPNSEDRHFPRARRLERRVRRAKVSAGSPASPGLPDWLRTSTLPGLAAVPGRLLRRTLSGSTDWSGTFSKGFRRSCAHGFAISRSVVE